ncbi:hypothetical protein E4P42_21425 [Mycobacterium sp. PS03-16]|uniref:hypothetical protein n=1 Tax=Mycobacterium sp. PS03-16 TaxID=2559611 RepID=UPI0010740A81|nr:hypothetical protein [Mycobacterium sp. PS03-16]TFV55790.1 hypothetical protein E4P42_21425 [Mycobacterium sp. PS03-16]
MKTATPFAAAAAAVFAGLAAVGVAHAQPEPSPPPPSPASDAPAPGALKTTIDANGTYRVGVDIAPGTYSSGGPIDDGACYWKRVGGEKTLDNALTKKAQTVRIEPTDTTFTTNDCQSWILAACGTACPPPPPPPGPMSMLGQLGAFLGPKQFTGPPTP